MNSYLKEIFNYIIFFLPPQLVSLVKFMVKVGPRKARLYFGMEGVQLLDNLAHESHTYVLLKSAKYQSQAE